MSEGQASPEAAVDIASGPGAARPADAVGALVTFWGGSGAGAGGSVHAGNPATASHRTPMRMTPELAPSRSVAEVFGDFE